ncbi:uncharacterized protein LOC132558755 [Ylistrum balloti]|uniref:uncharacterized protein LOC132558755 n=1 Tax=Ylistrum balloti TaxID=509963 RepID=UPI002905DEF0|nr:uncharacterized protein LOC132558755 [Ylistrum balloti]
MDTAIAEIKKAIAEEMPHESCSFTLCKASVFPPTYRFKIIMNSDADFDELSHIRNTFRRLQDDRVHSRDYPCAQSSNQEWNQERKIIEFDIVPGFLLQTDLVPNPDSWIPMTCDRYAVMKWIHKERYADDYPSPDLLWRESTCGYEKHIIDISCRNERYLYILTACRVLKAYIDGSSGCSQLSSLLSSYHLKNIAIHCILLQINISSVKEALGYFMIFLEIGLEKEFLPHYFYGNSNIADMFSMLSPKIGSKRLNLLKHIPGDHFVQARLSLGRMQADLRPLYAESFELCNPKKIDSFRELCSVYDESGKCILM